jgi:hypothetical protein
LAIDQLVQFILQVVLGFVLGGALGSSTDVRVARSHLAGTPGATSAPSPVVGGETLDSNRLLTTKQAEPDVQHPSDRRAVSELQGLARKHHLSMSTMARSWLLERLDQERDAS